MGRPGLEVDLEVAGGVVLDRAHEDLLLPHLAAQVAGQRDPVVERMPLGGDHHDRALGILEAELLGAGLACDAVAENHVATGGQGSLQPQAEVGKPEGLSLGIVSGGAEVLLRRVAVRRPEADAFHTVHIGLVAERQQELLERPA